MTIRPATDADWPDIWPFWREVVDAGETYTYRRGMSPDRARDLWFSDPHVVVLTDDDRVLGTAKMGPNKPGPGDHVGTASFIVDPAAQGRGVGRALGEYAVAWHRREGFRGIQFNAVVETNTGAVRLWQSLGFTIVGTVPGAFRHPTQGYVGLHVMYLGLEG